MEYTYQFIKSTIYHSRGVFEFVYHLLNSLNIWPQGRRITTSLPADPSVSHLISLLSGSFTCAIGTPSYLMLVLMRTRSEEFKGLQSHILHSYTQSSKIDGAAI